MFDYKYVLSLAIPLLLLIIYTAALHRNTSLSVVARPTSLQPPFQTNAKSQIISTDEQASTYQLFLLEKWCTLDCQQNVSNVLEEHFQCHDILILPELHCIQAGCDTIKSKTPHQIGGQVVQQVTGVKQHIDNSKLPSTSIGERVYTHSVSNALHKETSRFSLISRIIQAITGMLPWALDRIDQKEGMDGIFDLSCFPNLGKGVKIYVIDTGCRATHEDLKGRTTLEKVARYSAPMDDNGHGTHIAGTAAGTSYGVCKLCDIVCIKTLDENNVGTIVDVVDSIEFVLEQKKANPHIPAVVVMSLGGSLGTDLLDIAVNKLANANVFPSVAAGNGFSNSCDWTPPRAKHAVTVGAMMEDDELRFSSNYGKCVSIVAPGEDIRSASHLGDSSYISMSGTSMAAPHVAGVAALMLGEDPDLTPTQILDNMKLRSKILYDKSHNSKYPILRILDEDCHLYGFRDRETPYATETPDVPPREETRPGETESSPTPSVSPSLSSSIMPSSSASTSILPTPSSNSLSASPSPSTWQFASASFTSTPLSSLSTSPSASLTPSPPVSQYPSSTSWHSLTPSSPTPSISPSTSQSPSPPLEPSISPLPSKFWPPAASSMPSVSHSQSLSPSPSISASFGTEVSRSGTISAIVKASTSSQIEVSATPTVSTSQLTRTSNAPSPLPSYSMPILSPSDSREPKTENVNPSASPTPFRFLADTILWTANYENATGSISK